MVTSVVSPMQHLEGKSELEEWHPYSQRLVALWLHDEAGRATCRMVVSHARGVGANVGHHGIVV